MFKTSADEYKMFTGVHCIWVTSFYFSLH